MAATTAVPASVVAKPAPAAAKPAPVVVNSVIAAPVSLAKVTAPKEMSADKGTILI